MRIKVYELKEDQATILFEMNEAYFRFEHNIWFRLDDQGENNENGLLLEQKVLVKKLITLTDNKKSIFKRVLFYKNEIQVTLLTQWKKEIISQVLQMIKWSWPQYFVTNQ